MKKIRVRGGGSLGWMRATSPMLTLTVTPETLTITDHLFQTYKFKPEDVAALEVNNSNFSLGLALRICHKVRHYPKNIEFSCDAKPEVLISQIKELGFIPTGRENS